MKIVAHFDFNGGKDKISTQYKNELDEIASVIDAIDAMKFKTKVSKEKTMPGRMLFSPSDINKEFKRLFSPLGWKNHKVTCDYVHGEMLNDYIPAKLSSSKPFREMDFVKPEKKLGVEIQFGKYSFMVYNVCAKMTIFSNLGVIDTGIEIVPVKNFADEMSTGVSYFEQFAWDLTKRGVSNIDIPVLILGIDT
ncbi:MAG: restriction endonuclease [Betaproteobacteria bacterium]|nr:restriction endonuclease [Betaproteobacteria bacterium]